MIIKLKNQFDVEQAAQLVSWLNRPSVDNVQVSLPWLDENEQGQSARALKYLFNDCGCLWGGPAFLITFVSYVVIQLHTSAFSWAMLGSAFLIAVGVALVAKFLGLGWSRWRLRVWFQRLTSPRDIENPLIRKEGDDHERL